MAAIACAPARALVAQRAALSRSAKCSTSSRCTLRRGAVVARTYEVPAAEKKTMPVVIIDNMSDPLATVVEVSFGNVLGELLDTIQALRNLGLDINRAAVTECDGNNRFYVTDQQTSEKITKSERIEEIRLTIINNMLQYHPESAEYLLDGGAAMTPGAKLGDNPDKNPLGPRVEPLVQTQVKVSNEKSGLRSKVTVETTDRPGLLVDIVHTLKDLSLNVISAEIDTIGPKAHDVIFVTYRGIALNASMQQLVVNALQYYLSLKEVETDESY